MTQAPVLKCLRGRRCPSPPSRAWFGPRRVQTNTADPHYGSTVLLGRGLRHRKDGDVHAAFRFGIELHAAIDLGEQSVILAYAYVQAGMPLGAALARENIAGKCGLAAKQLHAQALSARVATVPRRSACFLMSHGPFL